MNWLNMVPSELQPHLQEILSQAAQDFRPNPGQHWAPGDLEKILDRAQNELREAVILGPVHIHAELALRWNLVVRDFHQRDQWGFRPQRGRPTSLVRSARLTGEAEPRRPHQKLISYARTFLVPTLLLKASILYFGLKYSQYPDEGYGYGLIAAISLSLFNFALFLWKTRDDTDGEF